MILNLKRYISLLLVLMLLIGIVPTAYAVEATDSTVPEETVSQTVGVTAATDPTDPTEPTDPPGDATEPTEGTEAAADTPMVMTAADDYGIMTAATTQSSIMLFDFSDNGDYTSRLNSQLTVKYKWNGSGSTLTCYLKNFGWHFARYGGVPYADEPLYCIEPHRDYAASTSGNSVDRGVSLTGSGSTTGTNVWFSLNADRREAIGLILLYTDEMWDHSISVTTTSKSNNPNVPLRMAAQFLIFEIVCGLRDAETFVRNSSNECGTSGSIFYNAGTAAITDFADNYNQLVSYVQAALVIPSFTGASSSAAPTITLTGEETSVHDSNGVLSNFTFSDGNGAEFYKSGNTLYITQTGTISESTVFKATRRIPSAANSTYSIWYMSGSTYQTTISLYSPSTGSLNAYFKLKAPATAEISLTKTTDDGLNLSGWQFGIYSNSACTSLVSGPHTTNSSGKISVTGLSSGTYYVKELGHTDSAIDAQYTCSSTNPQAVTLTAGQTAAVSFHNKLNTGGAKLIKETNTGENLSGWQIGLYYDADCTEPVDGSPFTTGTDGTITVTGLQPGTYYAKEVDTGDPSWQYDTAVKSVTVTMNQNASVTFSNNYLGRGKIIKTMPDGGSVAGWDFNVYRITDGGEEFLGTYTSGEDGTIMTDYVLPGTYKIVEQIPDDSPYICEGGNSKTVTVEAGKTAEVTFVNIMKPGEIMLTKVNTLGAPMAGAEFVLQWSPDGMYWYPVNYTDDVDVRRGTCTSEGLVDGKLTSGEDGIVRFTGLHPNGLYRVTETKAPDGYQLLTEPVYEGGIQSGDEYFVQLTVVNAHVFELPMTGSVGATVQNSLQVTGTVILLVLVVYVAKKRRK